ncbi:MAG: Ig-like domain-containing protein, partial [Candidatus Bathyarchaeota archaeon]|nr:Ig-like domain-containing protein [Candidatus Bathyarchaeota archaeon]
MDCYGTESYYDEVIVLNGNLFVSPSGNLTFRKVTLKMNCTHNGQYNIMVQPGGKFYVLESSLITSTKPDKRFEFLANHDTTFRMNNSRLFGSDQLTIVSADAVVENSLISHNRGGLSIQNDGVVVRNNNISLNDDEGISVHYCSPTIYNNTITSNFGSGISIHWTESSPLIQDNIITMNEYAGIFCDHNCSPIIQGNNISSNDDGITLIRHSTGIIQGNLIMNNYHGIRSTNCSNPLIQSNIITSNLGSAVTFEKMANLTIQDNIIIKNGWGISCWNSSSIISSNLIAENLGTGIHCESYSSSTITNNTITSNIGPGPGISCYNHSDVTIQGNTITNTTQGDAIALNLHCTGIIQGNMITNNSLGIGNAFCSSPLIQGNIITSNWDVGVHCANNSLPEVHWNDIYGNDIYGIGIGIENDDSSVTVNATYNYWGDGPSTSAHVLYDPWLTESIVFPKITTPLSGGTVSSTVTVSTIVYAQSGVGRVEFYIDDQLEYIDYGAPYEWNWDTTEHTETEHKITVKAYDEFGLKTSTFITVFVDNTPPTVSIREPTPENTYSGTVSISVNATDNQDLTNVYLKVDDTEWLAMTYEPMDLLWKYDLNTTAVSDGQHTLTSLALDKASNPATTSTTLSTDNTQPTLTIQTPQSGTTVGMTLSVEIQASDASGISRIEFYLQDVLVCTDHDTPYEWLWDTTQYPNGEYTITVKAYDTLGKAQTRETTVTVKNVESPWWQTHLWTIIEVLIAIGGLMLGILTFLAGKKRKRKEPYNV